MRNLSNNTFRLVWYKTKSGNKFDCGEHRCEYLASKDSIFSLWFILNKELGYPHVEIYDLTGTKQDPNIGIAGVVGFNI